MSNWCIERAKYITTYLETNKESEESEKLKFAKAVGYYLSHRTPVVLENNLLAGTMTYKKWGTHLYPEIGDLSIWRNLRRQELTAGEVQLLNEQIFPYWMERDFTTYYDEKCKEVKQLKAFKDQGFCEISVYRGFVPDFKRLLDEGLIKLLKEANDKAVAIRTKMPALEEHLLAEAKAQVVFYESVKAIGEGLLEYVKHLGEHARGLSEKATDELQKQIYLKMARNCEEIPFQGAKSFDQAVQSIWFSVIAMGAECDLKGMSLGRLDQILQPYYERDLLEGRITEEEALILVKELCLKLYYSERDKKENSIGITIGGINALGEDGVNAVTYLFLRVISSLKGEFPIITARVHREKNEPSYMSRVSECVGERVVLQEDMACIKWLVGKGISLKNSRNYVGLVGGILGIPGLSYEGCQKLSIDLKKILSLAINNGRQQMTGGRQWGPLTGEAENFECMLDFIEAFKKQGAWLVERSIACLEAADQVAIERLQWPFASLFFRGCMERGEDIIAGGSIYADIAIRYNECEEVVKLLAYVAQNIDKAENRRLAIRSLKKAEVYKMDVLNINISTEVVLKHKKWLSAFLQDLLKGYSNSRGGRYFLNMQ